MARSKTDGQLSLHGRKLMVSESGNLVSNGRQMTPPAVHATITVGAEATNVRTINIALFDAEGRAIDYVETFEIVVFSSAAMTAFATGGSTGVAIGTNGALLALVAKICFLATSESDGTWDGTWTDIGTESVSVAVRLPNGNVIPSTAFANT